MRKCILVLLILSMALTVAFAEKAGTESEPPALTLEEIYQAARDASDAKDYARAAMYYELAADRGHAKSQNNLAYLYKEGLGVEQSNEKAMKNYQLAADQGLSTAQYNLGLEYDFGYSCEQSFEQALKYYQLAAEQGNVKAMHNLGAMYKNGDGVEQDYAKAMDCFQKALDGGFEFARVNIGLMYENGYGVEQSLEKAVECYRKAKDYGGEAAEAADAELNRLAEEGKILAYVIPDAHTDALNRLYMLNRASIAKMSIGDGPVYVIGHRSPDSDTVCSAIAYARLLTMLGYPASAAITQPVNPESAFILKTAGVETPPVLEDAAGKSLFLVDHSEYAQAVEGTEDAHIVGILDHHGVGTVSTGYQLVYEAKPIGATATIVWLDYLNYGLEIDKPTATLLLGAILSDTANLTGSTVTEADREAVASLVGLTDITDVQAFFRELHAEALSYEGMSSEEILFSDYKEYEASGVRFGIGLISAIDEEHARVLAERMKEVLPEGFKKAHVDLLFADVGIREGSEKTDFIIPCEGQSREYLETVFLKYDEYDGTSYIFRNGGLGRKSKFVPGLTEYLNAHPHA